MYRIGQFVEQITVKRESRTSDGMGGDTISLVDVAADIWAYVRPRTAKEIDAHDRVEAPAMYLFVIYNRNDIREDDRILWNGQTFNIRGILFKGVQSMFLEINAERGVTQ